MSQNPCNLPGPATENILHVVLNASTASAQSRMKQWPTWRQVCGKFHIHIHRVACQCLRELLERGMVQQVAKNHTHCGSEAAASPGAPLPARPSKAAGSQWHVRVHASDLQLMFNKASWIAADTAVVEQWFRQDGGNSFPFAKSIPHRNVYALLQGMIYRLAAGDSCTAKRVANHIGAANCSRKVGMRL